MIRDRNIQWARQRMYIPVWQFSGFLLVEGAPNTIASAAIGSAPIMSEISTFGLMGLQIADEDEIRHVMAFPCYWDISQEIWVRVWWTYDATADLTDNATWTFLYDQVDVGEAIIAPATALDTPIVNQVASATTAYTLMRSPRGIINANKFDESALDGLFSFSIEGDVIAGFTADEPHLLGVEFSYVPRMTIGGHNTTKDERG